MARPTPARNTLRRVRLVGGLIISLSKVKALRASAEAVVLAKDAETQCRSQLSLSTRFRQKVRLLHSGQSMRLRIRANRLNQSLLASPLTLLCAQPRAGILTVIVDCKHNCDILT